jgi:hypothetical protein
MSAKKRPESSVKVLLAFPEIVGGVEVDHVVMRRPKVRDNIAASKNHKDPTEQAAALIANLCEITLEELGEFDQANWSLLEAQYLAFIKASS